jgi:hypothetical protein
VPLPQQQVYITSRQPVTWTLQADVDWLGASTATGQTPDAPTVLVQAYKLADGEHTGTLTFTSSTLGSSVAVPVTVRVSNQAAHFDMDGDNQVTCADVQVVQAQMPSDNSQAGFDHRLDIDRDGDIDTDDLARILAQVPGGRCEGVEDPGDPPAAPGSNPLCGGRFCVSNSCPDFP